MRDTESSETLLDGVQGPHALQVLVVAPLLRLGSGQVVGRQTRVYDREALEQSGKFLGPEEVRQTDVCEVDLRLVVRQHERPGVVGELLVLFGPEDRVAGI